MKRLEKDTLVSFVCLVWIVLASGAVVSTCCISSFFDCDVGARRREAYCMSHANRYTTCCIILRNLGISESVKEAALADARGRAERAVKFRLTRQSLIPISFYGMCIRTIPSFRSFHSIDG